MATRSRSLRLEKGEKQVDFALKCLMKPKTYAAIEEGRSIPSPFNLKNMCKALGMTMDQFMETSPEPEADVQPC